MCIHTTRPTRFYALHTRISCMGQLEDYNGRAYNVSLRVSHPPRRLAFSKTHIESTFFIYPFFVPPFLLSSPLCALPLTFGEKISLAPCTDTAVRASSTLQINNSPPSTLWSCSKSAFATAVAHHGDNTAI